MNALDDISVELNCPECNRKQEPTIKQLRSSRYKCPGCGAIFNAKDFNREIADIEKQLKDMGFS